MDRISMLGDELLGIVLSQLTLKEATVTSILCRRWRNLWTLTSSLDFTVADSPSKHRSQKSYVRWVNHAILSCKNSTFKVFKLHFKLTKKYQKSIDAWVTYALEKKVQIFELNCGYNYVFPFKENRPLFKQLRVISLRHVTVSDEALEFLLHGCPLLQHVSVSASPKLSSVRIVGPFPSLRRLEVCWCHELAAVEIRDVMNLVYFKFGGYGCGVQFLLHNVPTLVDVSVEGDHVEDTLVKFSNILPQVEMLNVYIRHDSLWQVSKRFCSVGEMKNLKQLVVKHQSLFEEIPVANLLRKAPCLEKFVLEVECRSGRFGERKIEMIRNLFPHLKEVSFNYG